MVCCLNCSYLNSDQNTVCQKCGSAIVILRNHYRPIKPLGAGGFAKTYLAEDLDKLNELCVIKQFTPQLHEMSAINKAKELFAEEAVRLQQLGQHPQIPNLWAYFEQDHQLYLVQEYIDGLTLAEELKEQGRFNETQIREVLTELLSVLQFVHEQKVIHRDIKPENIIRRSKKSSTTTWLNPKNIASLVLIDFGVAKQLKGSMLAQPGTMLGSYGYVPMEQMQAGKAYPCSDLYSLGATCFHLLTGVNPWDLWKMAGYSWVSKWQKHLSQPISKNLEKVLDKLLQADYQQRYQQVAEVLADLNTQVTPIKKINYQNFILSNTLAGHHQGINSLAISADGKTLVSGSDDTTIKIWDLSTNRELYTLTGHTDWVNCVAISADGKTLISGSGDQTIKIWDLATRKLSYTLTGHSDLVKAIAITPDGKTLVSGSKDKTIKIWDLTTGLLKRTMSDLSHGVWSMAITPKEKTLVSSSESGDNTIKIWDLTTGELKDIISGHSDYVSSLAISPDGEILVSGSWDKTIKIWHLPTLRLKRTLINHDNWVSCVAISPDGEILVSGSWDKTIKIFRLATKRMQKTLTSHSNQINAVAISPQGDTIVSGGGDNTISIWRTS